MSFSHEVSVPYAIHLMDGIPLYGRAINVKHASQNSNSISPGNRSPNYGYNFSDDGQLRRPLFDNENGQFSQSPLLMTPPPILGNGFRGNFQHGYPSPLMSPWQQNGGQSYPGRNSPQSARSPSLQFHPLQMNNRQVRYLDFVRRRWAINPTSTPPSNMGSSPTFDTM